MFGSHAQQFGLRPTCGLILTSSAGIAQTQRAGQEGAAAVFAGSGGWRHKGVR